MAREGLSHWIGNEPDLEVCGHAETAAQGLEAVVAMKPDLVVTELTLPGKSGLAFIKDLQAVEPALPMLVISRQEESLYAQRVLRAGARGYLTALLC
jgi:DNA-binding NarL/FixJ family response regulator